jgi:hypothetical protein
MKGKKAMRKFVFAILLAAMPLAAQTHTAPKVTRILTAKPLVVAGTPTGVVFSWTYTQTPGVTNCPTTGTLAMCLEGFTITDSTTGATVALDGYAAGEIPPSALTFTYTPAAMFFGTQCFEIVANGYDQNSKAIASASASVCVTNSLTTLNPPTNFTGVAQ